MPYTCFIVDDELHAIETLVSHINKWGETMLCGYSQNPVDALAQIQKLQPDIVFLDIDMPQLSGLDLALLINKQTAVIFTTAFSKYGAEAFEKDAMDYLLKPVTFEKFLRSVNKVVNLLLLSFKKQNAGTPEYFFVNPGRKGRAEKVLTRNIIYLQSFKNYVLIFTEEKQPVVYLSLKELEKLLPEPQFIRVHRSFMINTDQIVTVEGPEITLSNGLIIVSTDFYREAFAAFLERKMFRPSRSAVSLAGAPYRMCSSGTGNNK